MAERPTLMSAAVMTAPGMVELRSFPKPTLTPEHVVVRVRACAICTWEQRVFAGQQEAPFPVVGGHELSGDVEAVGEGVTHLALGDQVVMLEPSCGQCEWCRRGLDNFCKCRPDKMEYHGIMGPWGFSEYVSLHLSAALPLLKRIPHEVAVFAEPLACAVHAMRLARVDARDTVVIIGGGTMGLLNLLVARQSGARVILSELRPERLRKGRQLGATDLADASEGETIEQIMSLTGDRGADVVIVAVGAQAANDQAIRMIAPSGRIVLFASAHPAHPLQIDPNDMHRREYQLLGAVSKTYQDAQIATRLLAHGVIDPRPLIDRIVPLSEARAAMKRAIAPDSYRVILELGR